MTGSFDRLVVGVLLTPYIALSAMVAPEHVHEPDGDHPHTAVHRHLQPHSTASHDADHAQLADDDEHVVWLDSAAALQQSPFQFAAPAAPPSAPFQIVPALIERVTPPDYDTAPPHGPPRACLSLRGPPCLSA